MKLHKTSILKIPGKSWIWAFLSILAIAAGILAIAAGILATIWPQAVTLITATVFGLLILVRPRLGWIIIMTLLYLPVFPNIRIGGLETSITAPLLILLAGIVISQRRKLISASQLLASWQKILLAGLILAFSIATIFSQNYSKSLPFVPNLIVYAIGLFVTMALIDSKKHLVMAVKVILVLGFARSIFVEGFNLLRGFLSLPEAGVNYTVFTFHPAFALCLIILITPGESFSRRWRIFAGVTLISLVFHGVLFETRAAWVAWILLIIILLTRLPLRRWIPFVLFVAILLSVISLANMDVIQRNFAQTQRLLTGLSEGDVGTLSNSDQTRRFALEEGLTMFYEHPILGWGPNMFSYLKPLFVTENNPRASDRGAFNAWLKVLVDMGLVGVSLSALMVVYPLLQIRLNLKNAKSQAELNWIAFGFTLGTFGLAVHLLFIDAMFSFYWIHVGLALAATRLVIQPKSKIEQKISVSRTNVRYDRGYERK